MSKKIQLLILSCSLLSSCNLANEEITNTFRGIHGKEPAKRWQDALITGNGKMGMLVFGKPRNEKIIFNHEFLYDFIGTEEIVPPDISDKLEDIRILIKQGKYTEAKNLSHKTLTERGLPGSPLWTDPYHPAFEMSIKQDSSGEVFNYIRSLDFESGEIEVAWSDKNGSFSRKSFTSRAHNINVQRIQSTNNVAINCFLGIGVPGNLGKIEEHPDYEKWRSYTVDQMTGLPLENAKVPGIRKPKIVYGKEFITYRSVYLYMDRAYEVAIRVIAKKGIVEVSEKGLQINNAEEILVYSKIEPLDSRNISKLQNLKEELNNLPDNYEELFLTHSKIHADIFNRNRLTLMEGTDNNLSTEELIKHQSGMQDVDAQLLQKMYDMGRYTLLSSSGDNPPNLMGIWNGEWRPMWSGDFTLDANLNLQISSANIGLMPEAMDSYMKLLERLTPDWEVNARNLYGCRGYMTGSRTSGRRNLQSHYHKKWPMNFWLSGAGWLLNPCFEYYQCTGDKIFLKERLLPLLEKAALFWMDFLKMEDENGNYLFAPSYSAENWPSNTNEPCSANATMDIAVAKEVINNLLYTYKELDMQNRYIDDFEKILQKLPPYLINEDGALKEWSIEGLYDNYDHRHSSHLYPVWPGLEINREETPRLFKAAKVAARLRGPGDGSAHGLSIMALQAARLKDGNLVHRNLKKLLSNGYINSGLFTNHNPGIDGGIGEIFNSDALCTIPTIVMESLVYSRPGRIELLPAWSIDMSSKGSIEGMGTRTTLIINKLQWDLVKKFFAISATSLTDQSFQLVYDKGIDSYYYEGEVNDVKRMNRSTLEINLNTGDTVEFKLYIK